MAPRFRLIAAAAAVLAVLAVPAIASAQQVRIGQAPVLPAGTKPLASVASSVRMRITVALAPRNAAALQAYATGVSNPSSADYHHYLAPAQFARQFAPTAATVAAVRSSLRGRGLDPGRLLANGLALPITAQAGAIERALSVVFERVRLPTGRAVVLASQAPAVDAGIARDVQAVIGLSGLAQPSATLERPNRSGSPVAHKATDKETSDVATGGPQPCAAVTAAATAQDGYTADQIASAYDFSGLYAAGDQGQGETIAVYELESDDPADIAAYQACYGTDADVGYVPVDGGAGSGAGSGEAALDIDQLIGLAPKAHLLVYQGPNSASGAPGSGPYDTFAAIVSQDAAQVISNSWGECEPLQGATAAAAENVLFEEAAAQGQTMVSVTGDDGSEDCDGSGALGALELAVDDPGSQPFVTGVGGTSMTATGPPPTETTWNSGGGLAYSLGLNNGYGSGGGGISSFWPMPAYQSTAPSSLNVLGTYSSGTPCKAASGDCREVPDVSADADPDHGYMSFFNGSGTVPDTPVGWGATGGTSGSAPLWAALFALTDADKACDGQTIGFANPALYRIAATGEGTDFHDITSGNNDFTGAEGSRYPAGPGYDMATGLGTPDAAALAASLCASTLRLVVPAAQRSYVGTASKLTVGVADASGTTVRLAATGLPTGLSVSSTTHRITGTPTKAGSFAVTLEAIDSGGAVRVVHFAWTVGALPSASTLKLGSPGAAHQRVSLTVSAGRDAPLLRSASVAVAAGLTLSAKPRRAAAKVTLTGVAKSTKALTALQRALKSHRLRVTVKVVDADGARASVRPTVRVSG
jgi:subtilase family serine protease